MTTESTNGTTLAVREFSDKQIRTRLEAAAKPGFGMEKATRDQMNMVYLLAQHYDVDPAIDITLFQGRPFFTIDGRVRLMKRHPQYAGYSVRPLPKDEKEAWGYRPDEIVVECSIRTKDWGVIAARGKVSPDEFRRQPVAASHPQEMAEKRAIARASRMAFGQDVPDEDEVGFIIEERNDPERNKALAAQQVAIFGADEDGTAFADQPKASPAAPPPGQSTRESAQPTDSRGSADVPVRDVTTAGHPLWRAWVDATAAAEAEELAFVELALPITSDVLQASTATLLELVADKRESMA